MTGINAHEGTWNAVTSDLASQLTENASVVMDSLHFPLTPVGFNFNRGTCKIKKHTRQNLQQYFIPSEQV